MPRPSFNNQSLDLNHTLLTSEGLQLSPAFLESKVENHHQVVNDCLRFAPAGRELLWEAGIGLEYSLCNRFGAGNHALLCGEEKLTAMPVYFLRCGAFFSKMY